MTDGYLVPPFWSTLRNDGGAGSPNAWLNTARSRATFGASYAVTIAIVWPAPVPVRPSEARTWAGV